MSYKVSTKVDNKEIIIETGKLAEQAGGAVTVRCGDTIVLVTATAAKEASSNRSFFPLTVQYQEKTFAAGKIPGGFFKREGRPSEQETLTSRFIDRPIRPLFPDNFMNETQVIATVLSSDIENEPDVLAMTGTSAALALSPIPFEGPIAGVRVVRIKGEYKINPTPSESLESDIELIVAANRESVVMVEGGADDVPEEDVLEAIRFAHEKMQPLFDVQDELVKKCGKEKWEVPEKEIDTDLLEKVEKEAKERIKEALSIQKKADRYSAFDEIVKSTIETLTGEDNREELEPEIKTMVGKIKKDEARKMIFDGKRIDGRKNSDVRAITAEAGILPRVHGSALFTRGETQVVSALTLGTAEDQQRVDNISGEYKKQFMLHYNFPPFSVGEVKMLRGPTRREVGHGFLAERALKKVVPQDEDFPYTVRIVSEVLSSNGSSSMATVCSASMALMDAGVDITDQVAGIAMGLVKDGEKYVVLSDILGDEDHLGDMDFKVTGTRKGITALQMDIKIGGISQQILTEALKQARDGRLHILDKMNECIDQPRKEISEYAPKILAINIDKDKIKDVIGSGGKMINKIISETGVKMNVEDDGMIQISSTDNENAKRALKIVKSIVSKPEVGKYYKGEVTKVVDFGAFVKVLPSTEGLVHISELEKGHVKSVGDVLNEGDEIVVKVLAVDPRTHKIRLSRKEAFGHEDETEDVVLL